MSVMCICVVIVRVRQLMSARAMSYVLCVCVKVVYECGVLFVSLGECVYCVSACKGEA